MPIFFDPIVIGSVVTIIGVIALVAGALKVAYLEINLHTTIGRITLFFSVSHILVGLAIIISDLMMG